MSAVPIKRALLSVSNKTGLVEFASGLNNLGIEIISTGGTGKLLSEASIPFHPIETITGVKELLDGRVKTLHPNIHGGILGRRDHDAQEALEHGIDWIDLVVVNFYPFSEMAIQGDWDEAMAHIDIGGPTMVRAAAKNCAWVGVVIDPDDYHMIIEEIKQTGTLSETQRKTLAQKAFHQTQAYDAKIYEFFSGRTSSSQNQLNLSLKKHADLRYGENPHQKASVYKIENATGSLLDAVKLQGKPLSYNNFLDTEAALSCLFEFDEPACVIIKHTNPCGLATADDIETAFQKAYHADAKSAFGGIVAINGICSKALAEILAGLFLEVVIAKDFTNEAKTILSAKTNLRLLSHPLKKLKSDDMRFITGAVLIQESDTKILNQIDCVTKRQIKEDELKELLFSWRAIKHVKSNAILIARNQTAIGIGAGQVSRIDAVKIALDKAGKNLKDAVLASDAFFPFRDSIDYIATSGITAIIQPGGAARDKEVIAACDEHQIAMGLTHTRCFKH